MVRTLLQTLQDARDIIGSRADFTVAEAAGSGDVFSVIDDPRRYHHDPGDTTTTTPAIPPPRPRRYHHHDPGAAQADRHLRVHRPHPARHPRPGDRRVSPPRRALRGGRRFHVGGAGGPGPR
ncbi:MAG: hypothetical protein ACTSU9_12870 [Promethearchaeota archaeon]